MSLISEIGRFFADNSQLLLSSAWGTVKISLIAMVISIVIGVPLGVYVGHLHRLSFLAINGGNVLRALPSLALIAIGIGLYGFGFINILICLVVLALPLILTNAYVAVDGVDPAMVQAATGMGLTGGQIIWRVEIPNAIPLIMAGIRTATVYVLATSYLGAFAGYTGTLGDIIANITGYRLQGVLAAAIVVIVVAFVADFLLARLERGLTPKGLRSARTKVSKTTALSTAA